MANEYEASVEIDTSGADKDLKRVNETVGKLDSTINQLDKSLTKFQQTLSKTASAMQTVTKAQRDSDAAADKAAATSVKLATAREKESKAILNTARAEAVSRRERDAMVRSNEGASNSFQAVTGAIRGYTAGAQDADRSTLALAGSMSNTRYLLYDIGATYRAISIALLAIPTATTAVAASFQKDFAQVERTTVGTTANMDELKESLKGLTEEIPLSFAEMSKIASLGAQLGVQAENLAAFTETVAKFSASTGVSAEEAGAAFGRIGSAFNLDASQYEKLGSAIAQVGVSSAATETEIIAITQQLAPLASLAGFSAQEVIGLSGALASMRIRPELARGAFQSTIFKITDATEAGGKSLKAYADIMGLTSDEAKTLFKQKPAEFFNQYIAGIGKAMEQGQSFTSILDTLGVKEKRERQFILAMANQYGFLGDQMKLANDAYNEGTFLDKSSAKVFETFAAELTKLGNALKNLGDDIGAQSLGVLSALVKVMGDGAVAVREFVAANPLLAKALGVLMGFGAVIGLFFAIRTAMAFVMAAMVGFQQVASRSAIATSFSFKGLASQMAVTALVSKGASASMAADAVRSGGIIAAANGRIVRSADGVVTGIARGGGAIKNFGALALSAVGGPIGILIGSLAVLGLSYGETAAKAEVLAEQIANANAESAESGLKVTAEGLNKINADITNSGTSLKLWGKSVSAVAGETEIGFDKIVAATAKGKEGSAELMALIDEIAKRKGFADSTQFLALGGEEADKYKFILSAVGQVMEKQDKLKGNTEATDKALKELGADPEKMREMADETNEASTAFDKLSKNIDDAAKAAFGIQNAAGAANAALNDLGTSLQKSNDLSINTEGGRENLSNAQDAVTKYAMSLATAVSANKITAEQAAADYAAYVEGLFSELTRHGVDPAQAQGFVDAAKTLMGEAAAAGDPVTIPVSMDAAGVQAQTAATAAGIQAGLDAAAPTATVNADTAPAQLQVGDLVRFLLVTTGDKYTTDIQANTTDAISNVSEFFGFSTAVVGTPFEAAVTASTTAGQNAIIEFANWAQSVLNNIQSAVASVVGGLNRARSLPKGSAEIGSVRTANVPAPPAQRAAAPRVLPTIPTPNTGAAQDALKNLGRGYDDAANAAKKAGDAGNKAGKDAADGIGEAAKAADDYGNRLKTGLTAAFDQQYGLQKATDDYYSALNAIEKKREDENKQVQDLIDKQKELNNAREGDLVNARKAEAEAAISRKYGETDRAADYEQQAEEAKLSAAEKQKNIDAGNKEIDTITKGQGAIEGYSQAAIDNREALRNLESKTLDMIAAYAATGASQEQVRAYAQKLTAQFQIDAGQITNNRAAMAALAWQMDRYVQVVNAVPMVKPTTVTANTGAATTAMGDFNGAADWATRERTVVVKADTKDYVAKWFAANVAVRENYLQNLPARGPGGTSAGIPLGMYAGGQVPGFASGGLVPGRAPSDPKADNMLAKVDGRGMIAIRSQEYIMPQPSVEHYGLPFMEAVRNMTLPRYNVGGPVGVQSSSSSSSNSSSPMLVELTAENIQAILRLADKPTVLYAGVEQLASTVNEGQKILASKGVK